MSDRRVWLRQRRLHPCWVRVSVLGVFLTWQPIAAQDCAISSDDWDDIQLFRRCLAEGGIASLGPRILHRAALLTGNPTIVYLLLEAGADPNSRTDDGRTALHAGAQNRNPIVTSHLLEAGANPRARNNDGLTPLHDAARRNDNRRVITALIEAGADPLAEANDGRTPLHSGLRHRTNRGVVSALLEAGAADALTPLQLASVSGDSGAVAALLAEGVDPNAMDPYGWTSLHFAAPGAGPGVVRALLGAGADPSLTTASGVTALHLAAIQADEAVVAALVDAGADLAIREFEGGLTPLDEAIQYGTGRASVVVLLLRAGADPGSAGAPRDNGGRTPLHHALIRPESGPAVWKALLDGGADPAIADQNGATPLHFAAITGDTVAIEALLSLGADPAVADHNGTTPLHAAARVGDAAVIEALLTAGADVTARNDRGNLPMDLADVGSGSYWRLVIPQGELVAGRAVTSLLSPFDAVASDSSYQEVWTYRTQAGQRSVVTMVSDSVDAYLRVVQRDGNVVARNDDGGDGTDARLEFEAPNSGDYLVVATTFGSAETGAYSLHVRTNEPGPAAAPMGEPFRDCEVCPLLVTIPAGTFVMGSPTWEEGRFDHEGPRRFVNVETPFAVGVYEVTFEEWEACRRARGCPGDRPDDEDWGRGLRPVINVSWDDAQAYVSWLSQQTGARYRLLSEAEWEYVARAGSVTARFWGEHESGQCRYANGDDDDVSCRDGHEYTAPVGSFAPNGFGLYDVLGNVWEWTQDCWNGSYAGAPTDGSAWMAGNCGRRVLRGGSWGDDPRNLRSAGRGSYSTDDRYLIVGFRVARTLN